MFLLECKASSKPWIVFLPSEGLVKYNRLHTLALTSKAALNELAEKVKTPLPAYIENSDPRGYSLRQAFGTDDDPAYTAAFGLLKSCAALTRENGIPSMPRHAFAFPVLVVDSPLFECRYRQGEEIELTEVQVSSFLFQNRVPEHRGCRVTVVTRPHLDAFAAYAKELANEIRADFNAVQKRYISGGA